MFGTLRMRDIRTHHVRQFIQYLYNERPRGDGAEGHIAPSTVKRYTTVLRAILTLAYKMEYIGDVHALESVDRMSANTFDKILNTEVI